MVSFIQNNSMCSSFLGFLYPSQNFAKQETLLLQEFKQLEKSKYAYKASGIDKIELKQGQSLCVEPSALLACKNLEIQTGFHGTTFEVMKRYCFGGESLFRNAYTVSKGQEKGWISLEEPVPGQIGSYDLRKGEELTLSKGSYVAADSNVQVKAVYNGLLGWMKGIGFGQFKAALESEEKGRVFFNSSTGIVKAIEVSKGDSICVDNNNIIAYTSGVKLVSQFFGNAKSALFSGEGVVFKAEGEGVVFVGSGESAARKNALEKMLSVVVKAVLPEDPTVLINRVTWVALAYILSRAENVEQMAGAVKYLGRAIVAASINFNSSSGVVFPSE